MKNNLTNLENKEILETLTEFGLGENEILVYLELLKKGKSTLTPISNELDLPITTIQSILIRLNDQGLIMSSKNKSRTVYEAYDPSIIKTILKRKLDDINTVLPLLRKMKNVEDEHLHSNVKVYHRDRVRDVFHQALNCESKLVYEIVSAKDFQEIIGEKFHFSRRRVKDGVRLKSLRVRAHEIKKYSKRTHADELREAKFLPHELDFLGSMMIWDNSVAFFTSKKEGIAIVIESKVLRDMFLQVFELLWSISGAMETKVDR